MPFKIKVAEMIAYRAAYICSNPECNTLTISPALTGSALKNRKEEAAHIIGEKPRAARLTSNPSVNVDSVKSGLWLCANCHTSIDKNNGIDYAELKLFEQKKKHEDSISVLLRTYKSPLPLILRQSANREIAQNTVDCVFSKSIYFQRSSIEDPISTINSIDRVRKIIQGEMKDTDTNRHLKEICREIQDASRESMSKLSLDSSMSDAHLSISRKKTGRQLKRL